MNIVTKAEADEYMADKKNFPDGGISTDLIQDISARMARYCGRTDWGPQQSRTEYYDGGTQFINVNVWPIASITSIYDDATHTWDASTLQDTSSYHFIADDLGIVFFDYGQTILGYKNIKITYTAGYASEATVPTTIKRACLLQIEYDTGRTIPGNYQNVPGEYSSDAFDSDGLGLVGVARSLLAPYRRRVPFA